MTNSIINIENGTIRQQGNTILSKINLQISEGDFVYIIGKVGSGKSTFLKMLYAELPLAVGSAEVAGFQLKRIKTSKIPMLRRTCGIVFQDFKLLTDRSVNDNLEFVLRATGWKSKKDINNRIKEVLTDVGLEEKRRKMPHELSGGEQQRIVLARALLNSPQLIIADEPTGNIDPENSYKLIELLRDICRSGKTVLIATHQYDLISRYPGRVLRCENGEIGEATEISRPQNPCLATDEEMAALLKKSEETVQEEQSESDSANVEAPSEPSTENEEKAEKEENNEQGTAIAEEQTEQNAENSEVKPEDAANEAQGEQNESDSANAEAPSEPSTENEEKAEKEENNEQGTAIAEEQTEQNAENSEVKPEDAANEAQGEQSESDSANAEASELNTENIESSEENSVNAENAEPTTENPKNTEQTENGKQEEVNTENVESAENTTKEKEGTNVD